MPVVNQTKYMYMFIHLHVEIIITCSEVVLFFLWIFSLTIKLKMVDSNRENSTLAFFINNAYSLKERFSLQIYEANVYTIRCEKIFFALQWDYEIFISLSSVWERSRKRQEEARIPRECQVEILQGERGGTTGSAVWGGASSAREILAGLSLNFLCFSIDMLLLALSMRTYQCLLHSLNENRSVKPCIFC